MSKLKTVKPIDVSTESFPVYLQLNSQVNTYKVHGTKVLSANAAISPSGTPVEGMVVLIDYTANVSSPVSSSRFGDYKLEVFGVKIPYSFLALKLKIWCEYHNSAWSVFMLPSIDSIPFIKIESIDPAIIDTNSMSADGATGKFGVKDGLPFSKMEALTAVTIVGTNADGKVVSLPLDTYPSLAELAHGKGVTSAIQTQFNNRYTKTEVDNLLSPISSALTNRYTKTEVDNLLTPITDALNDTYSKAQVDALVAAVNQGLETYTTISTNTTLTDATMKKNIRVDAISGSVDITLPLANTLDANLVTYWTVMGANAVRLLTQGGDVIGTLSDTSVAIFTITGAGNKIKTVCDGAAGYVEC